MQACPLIGRHIVSAPGSKAGRKTSATWQESMSYISTSSSEGERVLKVLRGVNVDAKQIVNIGVNPPEAMVRLVHASCKADKSVSENVPHDSTIRRAQQPTSRPLYMKMTEEKMRCPRAIRSR